MGELRHREYNNTSLFMQQLELQQQTEVTVSQVRRRGASGTWGEGGNLSPHASSIMQSHGALLRQDSAERDMDADLEEVRRRYRSQSPTAAAAAAAAARERLAADLFDLDIPNLSPPASFFRGEDSAAQSSSEYFTPGAAAAAMSDMNASTADGDGNSSSDDSNAQAWKQFYRDNKPAGGK